ncbi:MAG: hypothetical protein ACOVQG_09200 [Crocinitomicaceae bacterium]|jgi:hypothetical protein
MLDILNFIVGSTSTLLSAVAIYLYIVLWKKDKTDGSYDVFDSFYKDILFKGMEHPELRNPTYTKDYQNKFSDNELVRYETYAFLTFNFCETLYDRGNENLLHTWQDVIFVEMHLHSNWLNHPDNQKKYKKEFLDFLANLTNGRTSRY